MGEGWDKVPGALPRSRPEGGPGAPRRGPACRNAGRETTASGGSGPGPRRAADRTGGTPSERSAGSSATHDRPQGHSVAAGAGEGAPSGRGHRRRRVRARGPVRPDRRGGPIFPRPSRGRRALARTRGRPGRDREGHRPVPLGHPARGSARDTSRRRGSGRVQRPRPRRDPPRDLAPRRGGHPSATGFCPHPERPQAVVSPHRRRPPRGAPSPPAVPRADRGAPIWASASGCTAADAAWLVRRTSVVGFWPEPLRVAHLVASAAGTQERLPSPTLKGRRLRPAGGPVA